VARVGQLSYWNAGRRIGAISGFNPLWNNYWGYGLSSRFCGTFGGFGNFGSWGGRVGFGFNNWGFNNWGYNNWGFNNWGINNWGIGNCGFGWGYDPFFWTFNAISPFRAFQTNYWNACYRNAYWSSWSIPNALPSSYWWYPSSAYCPTYLYVPSSVVAAAPEEEIVLVSAPAAPSIVDRARTEDDPAAAKADLGKSTPEALAEQYVELGDFYFNNDRFDAASEAYAKARNHAPEDASVHLVLADAVFANGDYHYAAFLIAEAVRLDRAIVTADVDKRDFYSDAKVFESQQEALKSYCTEKPYDAWAQLVLGYNQRFSDHAAESVLAFRRVLELDSDNPTAQAFLNDLVPALMTEDPAEAKKAEAGDAKAAVAAPAEADKR
jgi:hypothetical protein